MLTYIGCCTSRRTVVDLVIHRYSYILDGNVDRSSCAPALVFCLNRSRSTSQAPVLDRSSWCRQEQELLFVQRLLFRQELLFKQNQIMKYFVLMADRLLLKSLKCH